MQKQLEGLSFLDKRNATKPKLVNDQVPSASAVPPDADQGTGGTASPCCIQVKRNFENLQWFHLANLLLVNPRSEEPQVVRNPSSTSLI
jgi:hypothetical protein